MSKNSLRIIGGEWRGRRLAFPDAAGLRPTPDRVRETLFNWLAPVIVGAHCLDLFAGSGTLSFEALSRGAADVVMADLSRAVVRQLQKNVALLGAGSRTHLLCADALKALEQMTGRRFDIIFLDPPFHQNWIAPCSRALEASGCLHKTAWIYLEAEASLVDPPVPDTWECLHAKKAGQVGYWLFRRIEK